jgi:hypothetical protein
MFESVIDAHGLDAPGIFDVEGIESPDRGDQLLQHEDAKDTKVRM